MGLIERITMSMSIPRCILVSYVKTLFDRFFCVYFSKFSPVALIESITMSLSIPNRLLLSYVKTLSERFFFLYFSKFSPVAVIDSDPQV